MAVEDRLEQLRRDALAKEQRIDIALGAIAALHADEAAFVYAKLEKKMIASAIMVAMPVVTRTTKSEPAKKASRRTCRGTSFAARAEQVLRENSQGLRASEIAKAIGQTRQNVHITLRLLLLQGRVARHGNRGNTLWTLPGLTPAARIVTVDDGIIEALAAGSMSAARLVPAVKAVLREKAKREVPRASITSRVSKLVSLGLVEHDGADEHGIIYKLARKADEEDEDDTPTVN